MRNDGVSVMEVQFGKRLESWNNPSVDTSLLRGLVLLAPMQKIRPVPSCPGQVIFVVGQGTYVKIRQACQCFKRLIYTDIAKPKVPNFTQCLRGQYT